MEWLGIQNPIVAKPYIGLLVARKLRLGSWDCCELSLVVIGVKPLHSTPYNMGGL